MYIVINSNRYDSVKTVIDQYEVVYIGDSLTGIESVSGTVSVYANDGFLLRTDDAGDYARQIINDGVIKLTNHPDGWTPPPTLDERVSELEQTNSISFSTLAENGDISEETAADYPDMFRSWESGVQYNVGNLREYQHILYKCVQAHMSQGDWTPDVSASLWSVAGNPTEEWPEWIQPTGAHDAYPKDARVSHNDKHWTSDIDANTYEPGVSSWTEAAE